MFQGLPNPNSHPFYTLKFTNQVINYSYWAGHNQEIPLPLLDTPQDRLNYSNEPIASAKNLWSDTKILEGVINNSSGVPATFSRAVIIFEVFVVEKDQFYLSPSRLKEGDNLALLKQMMQG